MRFVRLTPSLLAQIETDEPDPTPEEVTALCATELATALVDDEGFVVGAGGVLPIWPGRAYCWLRVGRRMRRPHWVAAYRFCRRRLDRLQREDPEFARIEAVTRKTFGEGAALLRHLGFYREGEMRRFGRDGGDYYLVARVVPRG